MKCLQRLVHLLVLASVIGCMGGAKQEAKTITILRAPFTSNGSSIPVRWPENNVSSSGTGISLRHSIDIDQSFVPADEVSGRDPVEQMMHLWNQAVAGKKFFSLPVNAPVANLEHANLSSYLDGVFGIYMHNSWMLTDSITGANVSHSALAITQYYGVRRNADTATEYVEMTHADIIFNYADFTFTTDGSDYDFHTVLLHELGHFIGLGHHSDSAASIMYPFLLATDIKRSLANVDVTNLSTNYNPDALIAGGGNGAAGASVDPNWQSPNEGEEIVGIIELRADGECHHYLNGKFVEKHLRH